MVNAEDYQLDGRQFLTADDVLNLLLVGRVKNHHALITSLAYDDLRMTFAEAVTRLVGLLQSSDDVASAVVPETQERIKLTRLDFAEVSVEHKQHGHVIKPSRLDGDQPLTRGYYNVLRIDAQAFLRHFSPRSVIQLVRPASPLLVVADSTPAKTGAPGRPSSMHHIVAEFDRRRAASVPLADTLKAEAASLAEWFARNHEDSPVPTGGTIENRIRGPFNRARASYPTK